MTKGLGLVKILKQAVKAAIKCKKGLTRAFKAHIKWKTTLILE